MNTEISTSRKKSEQLVIDFFARVWGHAHDTDAIEEFMTEDYKITTGGKVIEGRPAFKAWVIEFQKLMLDARTVSQFMFSNEEDNKVVSQWICSGKNNGIFGLPADGRAVSFTGIAIWTIREGKLSECWVERSALELYQELTK